MGLRSIFRISIHADEEEILIFQIKLFFFVVKKIPVLNLFTEKADSSKKEQKKKKKANKKKGRRISHRKIMLVLKIIRKFIYSFKLRQLKINIDTGDVIRNAYLVPVFSMVYKNNVKLTVNYNNHNEFIVLLENNLGNIFIHIISTFIKHHLKK
jgi:hypothetical protein